MELRPGEYYCYLKHYHNRHTMRAEIKLWRNEFYHAWEPNNTVMKDKMFLLRKYKYFSGSSQMMLFVCEYT